MLKKDYVDRISESLHMTKKNVSLVFDELFSLFIDDLSHQKKVVISGFGTFEVKKTEPYDVYSPVDGSIIKDVSVTRVYFKSSNQLKKVLKERIK